MKNKTYKLTLQEQNRKKNTDVDNYNYIKEIRDLISFSLK